ncbi:MAG: hypothetical protein NT166_00275 [Candidatus Aminicenantes bacterium]|nr:hypothetical protein [Candidatus Aminicenantes bacterium]
MIMKELFAFQISEEKQALSRLNIAVALLILAMGLGLLQHHVSEYKKTQDQKAVFQDVEKNKVEQFINFRQYGFFGFRLLFLADPLSTLFMNSTVLQDMTAYIDSGERLNIYQSLKSRKPFDVTKFLFADCSGIYLCFVGLLAIFYGYMAFLNTEYLKFLASLTGKKKLFSSIYLSRASILVQFSLIYLASAVLLITINGVAIGIDQYLAVLFIKMCGVSLAFFALGAVFGLCESIFVGLAGAIASWFIPLFIIPFIVSVIVSANSGTIKPENQLEIEKLKLMMGFEKNAKEKGVTLELNQVSGDSQRKYIQSYYKNEFQKIQALEEMVKAQMQECTKLHYLLSAFFPTTGYLALTQEISSKGYENLYAFYQEVIQIKEAFFKEYIKQVYFSSQPAKVEPFLKGDENIFIGKPALPGYLLLDFFFNLLWIVGLAMLAYGRFKKSLFGLPEMEAVPVPSTCHIRIKTEVLNSWYADEDYLNNYLYNLLSGAALQDNKKAYPFTVTLNGQPWDTAGDPQNFLYLCPPKKIPGYIKVGNLLDLEMDLADVPKEKKETILVRFSLKPILKKRFGRLNRDEMGQVMLALLEMKPYDFYLINNIARKMYWEFSRALVEKMHTLSEAGAAVLFLTDEYISMDRSIRTRVYFHESYTWIQNVTDLKNIDLNRELEREQGGPNSGYQI